MNRFREARRIVGRSSSRWSFSAQGSGSSNEYSILNDPDLVAWYDAKVASSLIQADAPNRISQWSDLSGLGHHLNQATTTAQPSLEDGSSNQPSVLFDGLAHYMRTGSFTLLKPTTIVLVAKTVAWSLNTAWFDGLNLNSGQLYEATSTPTLALYAGSTAAANSDATVGSYHVVTAVFNGASSSLIVNNGIPTTGNSGAGGDMGGLNLGSYNSPTGVSNTQFKAIAMFSSAKSQKQIDEIVKWMQGRYAL